MYITKYSIAVSTTGAVTNEDYSANPVNGMLHAIQYTPGTLPSTAVLTLAREGASTDTFGQYWSISATTDNLWVMPRGKVVDSTGASTAWNSTAWVADRFPVVDERLLLTVVGATSEGGTAAVDVFVEGG